MRVWDRVRFGLFAERTVETLREQLNCYKSTINIAVSTAILLSTAKSYPATDTIRGDLYAKETEIAQEISKINGQRADMGMTLQKATQEQLLDENKDGAEVIKQLRYQGATLDVSEKLLESLIVEAHQVRTGQNITDINMSDGGRLLVGLFNCDDNNGRIRQDIHNVKATNHGKGVVGIAKGFDVNAFFNN